MGNMLWMPLWVKISRTPSTWWSVNKTSPVSTSDTFDLYTIYIQDYFIFSNKNHLVFSPQSWDSYQVFSLAIYKKMCIPLSYCLLSRYLLTETRNLTVFIWSDICIRILLHQVPNLYRQWILVRLFIFTAVKLGPVLLDIFCMFIMWCGLANLKGINWQSFS